MEGRSLEVRLEELLADFHARPLPPLTRRDIRMPALSGKAAAIVGMRRSGKTYVLYQEMRDLLAQGVPKDRLLYLNFEDDRLQPLDAQTLPTALETFYRRAGSGRNERAYLFLDEVQNVPDWEQFVRRVLDTENARLFLTGSSARQLSREIATSLRGRSLTVEVLPFSFREVLRHSGDPVTTSGALGAVERSRLEGSLRDYLVVGGFPEVQGIEAQDRIRVLQDYVELVLFRDVVERYQATNLPALRYMVRHLLTNNGRSLSANKLYLDMRSQGLAIGKDTVHEYLGHLNDAFLLFTVSIGRRSVRAQATNPRKAYIVDPGLAAAFGPARGADIGFSLEDAVYLELRRRSVGLPDNAIAYYRTESGAQVDFLVETPGQQPQLLQVCADASLAATKRRELHALGEAMSEVGVSEGFLVTLFARDEIDVLEGRIHMVPAWHWLLGSES